MARSFSLLSLLLKIRRGKCLSHIQLELEISSLEHGMGEILNSLTTNPLHDCIILYCMSVLYCKN